MKKFILPILLFLMFIPYIVNAETCDTDKITIKNIAIELDVELTETLYNKKFEEAKSIVKDSSKIGKDVLSII